MGIVHGGTKKNLIQNEILINFTFEPRGTKKSLNEICEARAVMDPNMRELYNIQAEIMIKNKFVLKEGKNIYIFSKDDQERYYWKRANFKNKLNYLMNKKVL